jgi:hypothetical protein
MEKSPVDMNLRRGWGRERLPRLDVVIDPTRIRHQAVRRLQRCLTETAPGEALRLASRVKRGEKQGIRCGRQPWRPEQIAHAGPSQGGTLRGGATPHGLDPEPAQRHACWGWQRSRAAPSAPRVTEASGARGLRARTPARSWRLESRSPVGFARDPAAVGADAAPRARIVPGVASKRPPWSPGSRTESASSAEVIRGHVCNRRQRAQPRVPAVNPP